MKKQKVERLKKRIHIYPLLNEATELRELYSHCLKDNEKEKALQLAEITIEQGKQEY